MSQIDNSNYVNLDQNHIQEIKYPDLSTYVPPPSYNSISVCQNDCVVKQKKIQFLFECYKYQAMSFLIVLVIQILGLTKWFMSISTKFSKIKLGGYYSNYVEYKQTYNSSITYDEHEAWRKSQYYEIAQVRWTLYVIIALLILNTLAILIGRINRNIVKYQKSLFYSQAILIGLSLVGYAGKYWENYWIHKNICVVIITTISILLLNSIVSLTLIKMDKLHYYTLFTNNVIYMQVPFNFILILLLGRFEPIILIFETIAIYGFYYFNQLNHSLLMNQEELPIQKNIQNIVNEITSTNNEFQGIIQSNPDLITIPKKKLAIILTLVVSFILLTIIILNRDSNICIPLILLIGSIFGLLLETSVASRSLQFEDKFIAASMVYIDILCPIKNLVRSIGIDK